MSRAGQHSDCCSQYICCYGPDNRRIGLPLSAKTGFSFHRRVQNHSERHWSSYRRREGYPNIFYKIHVWWLSVGTRSFQGRKGQLLIDSLIVYSRVNSTKSPASGTGNVSKPRLMSHVEGVREVVCAHVTVFLQSEWCTYRYSSAYIIGAIMLLW